MLLLRRGLEAQGELGVSTVLLQNSATGSPGLGPQSWWEHVGSPWQTQPSNIPPPSWLQGGQCAGQGWASPSLLSASHPLIPLLSSAVQTTTPPFLQHSAQPPLPQASFVSAARFTLMPQLAVFLVYRKASAPQRQTARGFVFYFPLIPASKHTPLDLLSCRLETSQANPITLGSLLTIRMISSSGIKKP